MIGIFDSGIGGLTVVKEFIRQLPDYQLIYFGDTARTPYGNKSQDTIIKYAIQDTEFLLQKGAKTIVVACNTASAVAAEELKKKFPKIPIFEVIAPAVEGAIRTTNNMRIGVIGTRATVSSKIYEQKITQSKKNLKTFSKSCPLLVPLIEEGWIDKPVTKKVLRTYLQSLKTSNIDTLILGCTHYPIIKNLIRSKVGNKISLIDPAELTVKQIKKYLQKNPQLAQELPKNNNHEFYFSDLTPHLSELMRKWLGQLIKPQLKKI